MHVIVPIAGPDFVRVDGMIKALSTFQGKPLLKYALDTRPWALKVKQYSFVLYDCEETRQFALTHLSRWFEGCSVVFLSAFSRGAALSSLAGLSVLNKFCQPLIIDLADIIYESDVDIEHVLKASPGVGGIALTFESRSPQYSYLACDGSGHFLEAAEKRVISGQASVGTYIFRDCATVLRALAHAFDNESTQVYNNLFYVCPLFNGLHAMGKQVLLESVLNAVDVKNGYSAQF